MAVEHVKVCGVQDFYELPLKTRQFAFLFLEYAGVIVRSADQAVAFDLGEFMRRRLIEVTSNLEVLLITHTHWDHYYRTATLRLVKQNGTVVVAEPQVAEDLEGRIPAKKLVRAQDGQPIRMGEFTVHPVVGVHPRPTTLFHLKWGDRRFFHGGDSGYTDLSNYTADVAFLPVGKPSGTCTPETALQSTLDLKSKIVVPMHGTQLQMKIFQDLIHEKAPNTRVIIPTPYQPTRIPLRD